MYTSGPKWPNSGLTLKMEQKLTFSTCQRWFWVASPTSLIEPEEVVQLARTCKRLYSTLPRFVVMCGNNFHINGPPVSNWAPERIIDGPPLPAPVKKLSLYVEWRDQGWGNRKGRLAVALVRGQSEEVVALQSTGGLGVAPHRLGKATAEVNEDEVVTQARPGDFYSFFGNVGGGGGHGIAESSLCTAHALNTTQM